MKDRWLEAAFRDHNIVAELLIRLQQSSSSSNLQQQQHPAPPPPPLLPAVSWGQKQARSTPLRKYSISTSTRYSPTTPLSWSPTHSSTFTSPPSDPSSTSRSKIFSQLKVEETELLKGKVPEFAPRNIAIDAPSRQSHENLKRVHEKMKEQRNKHDNLKRIKLDLNQQSTQTGELSSEPEVTYAKGHSQMEASITNLHQSILPRHATKEEPALTKSYGVQEVAETNKRGFFVPDLNIPVGDDEISAELW